MGDEKKGASIITSDNADVEVVERRDEYVAYIQILLSIANRARAVDGRVSVIANTFAATLGAMVERYTEKDITQLAKICQAFSRKKQREMMEEMNLTEQ
jgi:hypothetical protein